MFCSIKQEFKFKSASKEQRYDSLNIKEVKLLRLLLRIIFKGTVSVVNWLNSFTGMKAFSVIVYPEMTHDTLQIFPLKTIFNMPLWIPLNNTCLKMIFTGKMNYINLIFLSWIVTFWALFDNVTLINLITQISSIIIVLNKTFKDSLGHIHI